MTKAVTPKPTSETTPAKKTAAILRKAETARKKLERMITLRMPESHFREIKNAVETLYSNVIYASRFMHTMVFLRDVRNPQAPLNWAMREFCRGQDLFDGKAKENDPEPEFYEFWSSYVTRKSYDGNEWRRNLVMEFLNTAKRRGKSLTK